MTDLLQYLNAESNKIMGAMEKKCNGKKRVNHKKYIQKRLKPANKPKVPTSIAQQSTELVVNTIPTITRKGYCEPKDVGRKLPVWDSVDAKPYPCDPEVDEVLSMFDNPPSVASDTTAPYSPYSNSTLSESGEETTDLGPYEFGPGFSPAYGSNHSPMDGGYYSDMNEFSQFSPVPVHMYWH